MIICLEGIDASGKHTQAQRLAVSLDAELVSFPDYASPTGHLIKGYLKGLWRAAMSDGTTMSGMFPGLSDIQRLNSLVFQVLQFANKMERSSSVELGKPDWLDRTVILDRYWQSSWVYGQIDGLDGEYIMRLNDKLPQSDLNILLDVDPDHSFLRRPERRDQFEESRSMMAQAAELYQGLWQRMGSDSRPSWRIVDGRGTIEDVWGRLVAILKQWGLYAREPN